MLHRNLLFPCDTKNLSPDSPSLNRSTSRKKTKKQHQASQVAKIQDTDSSDEDEQATWQVVTETLQVDDHNRDDKPSNSAPEDAVHKKKIGETEEESQSESEEERTKRPQRQRKPPLRLTYDEVG